MSLKVIHVINVKIYACKYAIYYSNAKNKVSKNKGKERKSREVPFK
jgi:hypothetical protein